MYSRAGFRLVECHLWYGSNKVETTNCMTYNKSRVTSGKRDAVKSSNLLKPGGNKQDCSFNTNWTSVCCEKGVQLNYKAWFIKVLLNVPMSRKVQTCVKSDSNSSLV